VGDNSHFVIGRRYAAASGQPSGSWQLTVLTQQFLAKYNMAVIPHPPYSPDLAPCDFFLFPKLKLKLKGRRFDTIKEIQAESQRVLDSVTEKGLQEAFQK
jgi:hypothetical protein